jgi:hypothetical protein
LRVLNKVAINDFNFAVMTCFDFRLRRNLSRATNVECAHRKLRSWLPNRLRSNNTNRLTNVHNGATRKITPVTFTANTFGQLATQYGPDCDTLNMRILQRFCHFLGYFFATFNNKLARFRVIETT